MNASVDNAENIAQNPYCKNPLFLESPDLEVKFAIPLFLESPDLEVNWTVLHGTVAEQQTVVLGNLDNLDVD